jgi:hypothetical protein
VRLLRMLCVACKGRWMDTPGFVFEMTPEAQERCPYCGGDSVRPLTPFTDGETQR